MVKDLVVTLSPEQAASTIIDGITREDPFSILPMFRGGPVVHLSSHRIDCPSGTSITLVFTRYFVRVGSYVTLVAMISNLVGGTAMHLCTGGHRRWLDADLGATASFIGLVEKALENYKTD